MIRLTYRPTGQNNEPTGSVWYTLAALDKPGCIFPSSKKEERVLAKLADYEDAEQQGLIVPLTHGYWTVNKYGNIVCSICELDPDELRIDNADDWGRWDPYPPYCPNCGARMDGEP